MRPPSLLLQAVCYLLCGFASLPAEADPAAAPGTPAEPAPTGTSFGDYDTVDGYLLGRDNPIDSTYESFEAWKKAHYLPITIGAQNWFNLDRSEHVYGHGYGVPGERGTYYYFLDFDPSYALAPGNFVHEFGLHFEGRIRDGGEKLRAYYNDILWTYETYLYAKTDLGTFKVGQIVQEFCLPWDNSWWEGVSYFDGYRFTPADGFDWDNSWKVADKVTIDTAAQYYQRSDHVSGALVDASAETSGLRERNTVMLRAVPTWKINDDLKLALGTGAFVRSLDGGEDLGVSNHQKAYDADATFTYQNFDVWAQYIDSYGVLTPTRYVSGGPSNRQNSISTGVRYQYGPVIAHVDYSEEFDHDPSGHEWIFDPGLSIQLTKNLDLYAEYVRWDVINRKGDTSIFADGFELAFVWNL
jgi:hypothetical protein